MFSGLKYIIGYTDEPSVPTTDESANESAGSQIEKQQLLNQSMSTSGSALLEQTLNAVTTKITEQLLPPQASIEQLQSSSQHLLPSITEQLEENELKKKDSIENTKNNNNNNNNNKNNCKNNTGQNVHDDGNEADNDDDDDDDDCSEIDSWEMLDLVDNPITEGSLESTAVQVDESSYEICKSVTSGILKTSPHNYGNKNKDNIDIDFEVEVEVDDYMDDSVACSTSKLAQQTKNKLQSNRQKPKVSFETPDLVSKQEKNDISGVSSGSCSGKGSNSGAGAGAGDASSRRSGKGNKGTGLCTNGTNTIATSTNTTTTTTTTTDIATIDGSSTGGKQDGDITYNYNNMSTASESWCVTPPPCFTGQQANKKSIEKRRLSSGNNDDDDDDDDDVVDDVDQQPRTIERENLLIELPEIPTSSKTKIATDIWAPPAKVTQKLAYAQVAARAAASKQKQQEKRQPVEQKQKQQRKQKQPQKRQVVVEPVVVAAAPAATAVTDAVVKTPAQPKINKRQQKQKQHPKEIKQDDDWPTDDDSDLSDFDRESDISIQMTNHQEMDFVAEENEDESTEFEGGAELISIRSSGSFDSPIEELKLETCKVVEDDVTAVDAAATTDVELAQPEKPELEMEKNDENQENQFRQSVNGAASERRAPTQVRPIEPERRPGWQLKRKRSRRKSGSSNSPPSNIVASASVASAGQPSAAATLSPPKQQVNKRRSKQRRKSESLSNGRTAAITDTINSGLLERSGSSSGSSARSTPTLMDRIGSSIVANLNNLASGLVPSGTIHSVSGSSPWVGGVDHGSARGAHLAAAHQQQQQHQQAISARPVAMDLTNDFNVHKRMSKAFLKRQNSCVRQASSQRRPDRRLKMFATPNGCSINRKVQSNFR